MSIKINNEIWNLNEMNGCNHCIEKNEKIAIEVMKIMDMLDTETLFVTKNDIYKELTVFAGGSNCSNEFECVCDEKELPMCIQK